MYNRAVTRSDHIKHFPLAAGTEGDHLVGVNEMTGNAMPRHVAVHFSAIDNLQEIPLIGITKQALGPQVS